MSFQATDIRQDKNRTFDQIIDEIEALDVSAAAFLRQILAVSATWDDLVDRDHDVSDQSINAAFELALIDLPRNRFYTDAFHMLNPVVITSIQNWRIATNIEREMDGGMYDISFVIRSSYVDLFTIVGFILGGSEMAVRIGADARRFAHDEGRPEYEKALCDEKERREGR